MPSTTFEARLRKRRFTEDQEDGVICRWRHPGGLILDAMPSEPGILGFDNRWQGSDPARHRARAAIRSDHARHLTALPRADAVVLPRLRALLAYRQPACLSGPVAGLSDAGRA